MAAIISSVIKIIFFPCSSNFGRLISIRFRKEEEVTWCDLDDQSKSMEIDRGEGKEEGEGRRRRRRRKGRPNGTLID